MFEILLLTVLGYLFGTIPFGVLLTRAAGLGDIRKIGSGNIGATNVLRTGHKGLAAATLLLDGAKGAAALLIAQHIDKHAALPAGFAAFLGHLYPVWLRFKGGKGVATGLGVLLAASFPIGLIACAVWLATVFLLRVSSLGALYAFASAPFVALVIGHGRFVPLAFGLALFVFWRHRENIKRLRAGTEPKIGRKAVQES
jgi:acyl phosphate:glycerol-3-phosphate acyltransferase